MHRVKLAAMAFAALLLSAVAASAQPFSQCPAVGNDTNGCEFLINITGPSTFVVATSSPDQGPYDGSDDTLVGVYNSSNATVNSVHLTSTEDIFAFDGDGACAALAGCTSPDPSGYGGPGVTFTANSVYDGDVNFAGGLAPGASAWFSLEEALSPGDIGPIGPPPGGGGGTGVTPEPSSLMLLGTGALGLAGTLRRRFVRS